MLTTKINCYNCKYYYVTWDRYRPHGCKIMGFKSQILPCYNVRNISGQPCHLFTPKVLPTNGNKKQKKDSTIPDYI